MTETLFVLAAVERSTLSCVWVDTGNPAQPLACIWIDRSRHGAADHGSDPSQECPLCA
jgi:hypothetical protein